MVAITNAPPSRSCTSAAWTSACIKRPCVSTRMCRFLPLIFLPASNPAGSIVDPFFRALHALAVEDRGSGTRPDDNFLVRPRRAEFDEADIRELRGLVESVEKLGQDTK